MNNYDNFPQYNNFAQVNPELRELKKRVNSVGIMTIISIAAFSTVANVLSSFFSIILYNAQITDKIDALPDSIFGGLVNILALGVSGFIFANVKKDDINQQFPFKSINKNTLISLLVIGFSACMLSNFLTSVFLGTTYNLGFDFGYSSSSPVSNSALEIIAKILSVAVVPAFAEEILFRGAIMSSLRKYGDGTAILVSAVIFGMFHTNLVQIPFAFIVGLILGWTVVYTNSMLPAILIHFSNNMFSVVCSTVQSNAEAWNISSSIISTSISVFVVLMCISAIICTIKLSRNDRFFLSPNNYYGGLSKKEIANTFVTNPAMIGAFVFLTIETINKHIS